MMAIERIGASLTAQAGTIGPLSTILLAGIWLLARQPRGNAALEG
jgi:hypothetical protein